MSLEIADHAYVVDDGQVALFRLGARACRRRGACPFAGRRQCRAMDAAIELFCD